MNTPSPHFSNNKVVVHSPSEANVSDTIDGISFHLESNNNSVLNHHIDIVAILEDLKMDRYIDLFRREEIDLLAFCLLEREDLLEIKIPEEDIEPLMQAIVVHSDLLNISPETMLGPLNITWGSFIRIVISLWFRYTLPALHCIEHSYEHILSAKVHNTFIIFYILIDLQRERKKFIYKKSKSLVLLICQHGCHIIG